MRDKEAHDLCSTSTWEEFD